MERDRSSSGERGGGPAGGLAVIGGALAAIAVFLPWATFSISGVDLIPGGASDTVSGWGSTDGYIIVVLGIVAVLAGLAMVMKGGSKGVAIGALVAGLVIGGLGVYDTVSAKNVAKDEIETQVREEMANVPDLHLRRPRWSIRRSTRSWPDSRSASASASTR